MDCFVTDKMLKPIISILMPVHNAEQYLSIALDSLLGQSFKDYEIIAINDGSTDKSGAVLDGYANTYPCIRVFHRPQRGIVATLNEGIDLAGGEWIARMDSDDIALKCRLDLQLEHIIRFDSDFCGGAVQCFGESRALWRYPNSSEDCGVQLLFDVPLAHPAVVGRSAIFKHLRYDSNFKHAEDYDLWQRAWAAGCKITNIGDLVLNYRVHKKQVSFSHKPEQNKMADEVRFRQWKLICPDLDDDMCRSVILAFSRGEGKASLVITGLLKVLERIPVTSHQVFLNGALRIFLRLAGHDFSSVIHWFRLCNSSKLKNSRTKFRGLILILFIGLFRINSKNITFQLLKNANKLLPKL
jgi:glycosyltransferase involved in cell wall biosynthesis